MHENPKSQRFQARNHKKLRLCARSAQTPPKPHQNYLPCIIPLNFFCCATEIGFCPVLRSTTPTRRHFDYSMPPQSPENQKITLRVNPPQTLLCVCVIVFPSCVAWFLGDSPRGVFSKTVSKARHMRENDAVWGRGPENRKS